MLEFFDIIGVIAFSLSGYLSAQRKQVDLLGVFIVSFSTAFAGGMLRDMSINKIPFVYTEYYPTLIVIFTIIIAYIFKLHKKNIEDSIWFITADSIGLISFSITGAIIAINNELNFIATLFLALITATGGGVMKDILLQKKITLITRDVYGSLAIAIGSLIYVFGKENVVLIPIFIGFIFLRIYIKRNNISLPNL